MGSEKSPQVPDPRDPAWKEHLAIHEHWWDQCIAAAEKRGETMVITPEFGPWPYLARHPFSDETIADVTSVVAWMKERLRARYM